MKPAKRHENFPIVRVCMICGKGQTIAVVVGAGPALRALGYKWNVGSVDYHGDGVEYTGLGYAHNSCIEKKRVALRESAAHPLQKVTKDIFNA